MELAVKISSLSSVKSDALSGSVEGTKASPIGGPPRARGGQGELRRLGWQYEQSGAQRRIWEGLEHDRVRPEAGDISRAVSSWLLFSMASGSSRRIPFP